MRRTNERKSTKEEREEINFRVEMLPNMDARDVNNEVLLDLVREHRHEGRNEIKEEKKG